MRHLVVLGFGLAVLHLSACGSCGESESAEATEATAEPPAAAEAVQEDEAPPPLQAPDVQSLTFAVQGGRLDGKKFEVEVSESVGYWLYDPKGKNTMIAARGKEHGLDAYLYAALRMTEPGIYEFRPGATGADTRVQLRFRDSEANETFALLGVEGQLELQGPVDDYLLGTFSGKFVYSTRLGADLKDMPEDEREYLTVTDGRFAVSWKDRIAGKARRWSDADEPQAEAPTAATP